LIAASNHHDFNKVSPAKTISKPLSP
jgi:hypothetical protein